MESKNKTSRAVTKTNKNKDWLELCEWVEREIFLYDSNIKLHSKACMRLKGLQKGQAYANNKQRSCNYPFAVVLNAFKLCKPTIMNAIKGKTFTSEENKMAYVCAIVSQQINDVYLRMKAVEEAKEKTIAVDTTIHEHQEAEYKRQTTTKNDNKFEDMW